MDNQSLEFFVKLESISTCIGSIVACFTSIATVLGLYFVWRQLRDTRRIAQGEFLLRLDEMFRYHDKVHRRLRPGGEWYLQEKGPNSVEEWADVDSYMGLFERIKVLIDNKVVELEIINTLYGYRLDNILANNKIKQEKLEKDEKDKWQKFIKLCKALNKL
jgi:hypothetical protein